MVKIMLIDTGYVVAQVLSLFHTMFLALSPGSDHFNETAHVSYTAKAFAEEYGDVSSVDIHLCGFTSSMTTEAFRYCAEYAIQNDIRYINISYGPSDTPLVDEHIILKRLMDHNKVVVYSQGNKILKDIDWLYPNRFCLTHKNCYLAAAQELVDEGYDISKKSVVIKSETCIANQCLKGSSFAAPRLLARIIKQELKK
jgi:hypothetical protein